MDHVCDEFTRKDTLTHLNAMFQANMYPIHMISRTLQPQPSWTEPLPDGDEPNILYLPYIRHVTEPIQCVCRQLGVKTVFKSPNSLRQQLVRVKTPTPEMKKKKKVIVIYEVPFLDCESVCIGETGRCLLKRLSEHKGAVRRCDRKNGIATHSWDRHHRVNREET